MELKRICPECNGTGEGTTPSPPEGAPETYVCGVCHGEGSFIDEIDDSDILDKCNDILNKCQDILEQVTP